MNVFWACCFFQLKILVGGSVSVFPLLIVISFDGFRHDYLTKASTPNLHRLIETGVVGKWMKSAFITKTFPNHYSIATGLYEESHGIIGNEMFDPTFNETFNLSNSDPKWWDNGNVLPVWIANQQENSLRHSGSMMWPGAHVKIRNQTIFYSYQYNSTIPWEKRIDIVMTWLTNDTNPANCIFLYFEQPDAAGHRYGPDSKEVIKEIIRADNITGYLIKKLEEYELFEKINLIILSDHGMSKVVADHIIDMDKIINSSLYKKFGNSPVWNILPTEGQEEYVFEKLKNGSKNFKYTVYHKEEIPESYHYRKNRRVMPILIVADPGWEFITENENINDIGGQHGYNNSMSEMWPIFIAHGPIFQHNYSTSSFSNVDVYPLMCHILNIHCSKSINGSLMNVWNMLNSRSIIIQNTSLPTLWIIGIVCLLSFCIIGGLIIIVITTKRKIPTKSEFDMTPVTSSTVRTDRNNSSLEEQQQLLLDPVFDD